MPSVIAIDRTGGIHSINLDEAPPNVPDVLRVTVPELLATQDSGATVTRIYELVEYEEDGATYYVYFEQGGPRRPDQVEDIRARLRRYLSVLDFSQQRGGTVSAPSPTRNWQDWRAWEAEIRRRNDEWHGPKSAEAETVRPPPRPQPVSVWELLIQEE